MKRKKEFNNESKKQQNREITGGESVAMQETDNNLTLNEFVANYEESGTSAICDGEVGDSFMVALDDLSSAILFSSAFTCNPCFVL